MYEELVKSLREKAEFLTISDRQKAPPGVNIKNLFADTMKEAADAIEAMCELVADAYIENANLIASYEENRPQWIPVTERLPEEKISPMMLDYQCYPCVFSLDGFHEVRYYKFGRGHFWNGCRRVVDEFVTHWAEPMELPKEDIDAAVKKIQEAQNELKKEVVV